MEKPKEESTIKKSTQEAAIDKPKEETNMNESNDMEYRLDPALVDKLMNDIYSAYEKRGAKQYKSREVQREYIEWALAPIDEVQLINDGIHCIQNYHQHHFKTRDGRTFALFIYGSRILKFLEAEEVHVNHRDKGGVKRFENLAGFIHEIDGPEGPYIYREGFDLATAWEYLHAIHGVPVTKKEADDYLDQILTGQPRLGVTLPEDRAA